MKNLYSAILAAYTVFTSFPAVRGEEIVSRLQTRHEAGSSHEVQGSHESNAMPVDYAITPEQRQLLAKAYVWGWPLVYLYNIEKSLRLIRQPGTSGGAPVAPVNRLSMLTEPVSARFQSVPCPNRDVIYGFALLDLQEQPVVLQVPEAEGRLWMFQVGDHRTDSFAELGSMYGSRPGFYLVVGPDWDGEIPDGIVQVFRSSTNLAYVIPRYFVGESNSASLQKILSQVSVYPIRYYRGQWRTQDWRKQKWYPALGESSRHQCKSVKPGSFFRDLRVILNDVPPLEGEQGFYLELKSLLDRLCEDAASASQLSALAHDFEQQLMVPVFDFRNVGERLKTNWTTVSNAGCFGTDYATRAAVAKSNIFVNRPNEAKYFYLELDADRQVLNGGQRYQLTFPKDQIPTHDGYWSVTIYDENHRLVDHANQPASIVGTSQSTRRNADGSITFLLQRESTLTESNQNWLPLPEGNFVVYLRVYAPSTAVIRGDWVPPAATPMEGKLDFKSLVFSKTGNTRNKSPKHQ